MPLLHDSARPPSANAADDARDDAHDGSRDVASIDERQAASRTGSDVAPLTEGDVRDALRDVLDPEVGLNVVDLGLVYSIQSRPDRVHVTMAMTTPACPMGESIVADAHERVQAIAPPGVDVDVELVTRPAWTPDRMSDAAKNRLGWHRFGPPSLDPQAGEPPPMSETVLDVRTIVPRERHPKIFGAYHALPAGGSFLLVNDHDPKPLYYHFQAELAGKFEWSYLESGPEVWRVRIGKPA